MRLVSRSDNHPRFREAFSALPEGSPLKAVWARFLDLAPAEFAEFWVVFDGETPVGRIGASLMPSHPGTGAVGFFEVVDAEKEVAETLLDAAEAWLKTLPTVTVTVR